MSQGTSPGLLAVGLILRGLHTTIINQARFIVLTSGRYPQLRILLPSHMGSIFAGIHRFRMLLLSHLGFIRPVYILKPVLVAEFTYRNLLFIIHYRCHILSATCASIVRLAEDG